jgi:tetratricopeptide (TPR) repeat protein
LEGRGRVHLSRKEYESALADFNQAERLFLYDVNLYYGRARVYRALGRTADAVRDEQKARELSK